MKFHQLLKRLDETAEQLQLDFNKQPKPDVTLPEWAVLSASRKRSALGLVKHYQNIATMTNSSKRSRAYTCFYYTIKRRLMKRGFTNKHELVDRFKLPGYVAYNDYLVPPGLKCLKMEF